MIIRILGSEETQAREIAEKVINAIADSNYELVEEIVDHMGEFDWTVADLEEFAENFKEDNELGYFDRYDVPCDFNVIYKDGSHFEQEQIYTLNDGSGFRYEYSLTTDGNLNDLTLMLHFAYKGDCIEVSFYDIHVL